jgi:hypothetical protein
VPIAPQSGLAKAVVPLDGRKRLTSSVSGLSRTLRLCGSAGFFERAKRQGAKAELVAGARQRVVSVDHLLTGKRQSGDRRAGPLDGVLTRNRR